MNERGVRHLPDAFGPALAHDRIDETPLRFAARAPRVSADDLARFRAGDPEGVRAVYRSYKRVVFAVARRMLGSHDLAEEATQATFVKAWRAASSFDSRRELGPWLATIARHAAIDVHRREARRPTEPLDERTSAAVILDDDTEQLDAVWAVRSAIDCLAPGDQAVVRLMHLEQLTQPEVAERLGIPLGTVKSRAHRAHRQLAASLVG